MRFPELGISIADLTGADPAGRDLSDPKAAIRWVRTAPAEDPDRAGGSPGDRGAATCRWVQLDAARRGLRPRELTGSGRRDLAAFLRREELWCSGLDLWIPAPHFADPARVDRAVMAVEAACELAADLDAVGRVVCVALPEDAAAGVVEQLDASGERFGVRVADCSAAATARAKPAVGIDPAAALIAGADPIAAVHAAGVRLAAGRLSDLSAVGRCVPGAEGGRLDLLAYAAAFATAGFQGPLVIDLRGLPQPAEAAARAADRYRQAAAFPV